MHQRYDRQKYGVYRWYGRSCRLIPRHDLPYHWYPATRRVCHTCRRRLLCWLRLHRCRGRRIHRRSSVAVRTSQGGGCSGEGAAGRLGRPGRAGGGGRGGGAGGIGGDVRRHCALDAQDVGVDQVLRP